MVSANISASDGFKPRVAISDEFLKAFARIPKSQQKKVRAFVEKFRADPTQKSINYESIHKVVDSKIRTVRIDKQYRAVVIHPPKGDVYLCVWVDNHDEAMAWARHKRFEVNPKLGSLQVYELQEGVEPVPSQPQAQIGDVIPKGRLLGGFCNDDLILAGVPDALVPSVRALRTDDDLDELAPYLPSEAADVLYGMAIGLSLEEAVEEAGRTAEPEPKVDVDDFAKALDHPDTQRRFKELESEKELREILAAPLELWRVFLHPSQRVLVEKDNNGPVRVLGGAGTGKTVVAMHRAQHLAAKMFDKPNDRILFTTFTTNLAADIQRQLQTLCGPELSRIEVVHLDAWARRFLKSQGVQLRLASAQSIDNAWGQAMMDAPDGLDLPETFLRDEWQHVVQANGITDRAEYLKVRRVGRGRGLNRKQRAQIWKIFASYREGLESEGVVEYADVQREAWAYLTNNPGVLPYKAVLADEVQDLGPLSLRLLRAMVPEGKNDLFVVGDAHQRIYGNPVALSRCGINIRGRSRRLKINYRTTEKIRDWSVALLEGVDIDDLDDGKDSLKGYRSLRRGALPEVRHGEEEQQEAKIIIDKVRSWLETGKAEEICIVARTKKQQLESRYQPMLQSEGVASVVIRRSSEAELGKGVRLATMHRVKGLEFPRMLIVGVQQGRVPLPLKDAILTDPATREDHEKRERCLLFVAATRARDELVVTGFGERSPFLPS